MTHDATAQTERIGFSMRLLPGSEAEYRRRHAAVWPDLLADLRSAGARNYSIFLRGDDLFAYLEVDDFTAFTEAMATSEKPGFFMSIRSPCRTS